MDMAIVREAISDEDGQVVDIYIEVDHVDIQVDDPDRDERGGVKDTIPRIEKGFKDAMGLIHTCARHVAASIEQVPPNIRPHGYELQFAIKIDTSVGALIAESSAGAQLQVTLKWGK
jgi:hypothetical protein